MDIFFGLASLRVEFIKVSSILIYNDFAVRAGEFDIVVCIVGNFLSLFRLGIVDKDVHGHVTVGDKENLVAYPHGDNVLRHIIGNVFPLFLFAGS